jgi:hypothetical protein
LKTSGHHAGLLDKVRAVRRRKFAAQNAVEFAFARKLRPRGRLVGGMNDWRKRAAACDTCRTPFFRLRCGPCSSTKSPFGETTVILNSEIGSSPLPLNRFAARARRCADTYENLLTVQT